MPTNPALKLPTGTRVALFRVLDDALRRDATLRRVVKAFKSWRGEPDDRTPPSIGQCPWVRLSISGGAERWWACSTMMGLLIVDVELQVPGTCLDDLDNLWSAVERAMYPDTAALQNAFREKLTAAGAHTGLVHFLQPAFDTSPDDADRLAGIGRLGIDYRFDAYRHSPGG